MTQLLGLDQVRPSAYNPRVTDPDRLELVKLSLRKLGFVLPIYANPTGEILSGHQRHLAAQELGWTQVPVDYTKPYDLATRRNLNVVFNRATNDMRRDDTSEELTAQIDATGLMALAAQLPDKQGDDRYPCLKAVPVDLQLLVQANDGAWNDYARNLANTLAVRGIFMPVVARRDFRVVNGIGRVQHYSGRGLTQVDVVFVDETEADFAAAMLNYLSMDFNIHERYADILRHNSFRRARGDRTGRHLGTGMMWPLTRSHAARTFDIQDDHNLDLFRQTYGPSILDFGAGRLEDVTTLRTRGIDADAFEPFVLTPGTDAINPDLARELTTHFLAQVASGKQWNTIFLQAVLNSVPFQADREHVVCLLAALAGPFTTVYAYTSARGSSAYSATQGRDHLHRNLNRSIGFRLDYEDGIVLGEYASRPKVQKFFTLAEFINLFRRRFQRVLEAREAASKVYGAFQTPRAVNRTELRAAIEFEFDLPYPDGSRLGLVPQALAAFSQRLGVRL